MKYGIFGDVHGNLEGLKAVLGELERAGVDRYLCMGDVVGYGADPNACCDLVREVAAESLFGNHDQACIGQADLSWFNEYARTAILWTADRLDADHLAWLADRPPDLQLDGCHLVHAALPNPLDWVYILSPDLAAETMAATDQAVTLIGHTHLAESYVRNGSEAIRRESLRTGGVVKLRSECTFVINPGSCGQPRDGNSCASYGLLDTEARTLAVHRIPYSVDRAAAKIIKAGLPAFLALRLHEGR